MSAYENLRNRVEFHEEKGEKDFTYSTKSVRNTLSEIDNRLKAIEKLQAILKNVPLQVGDVVHEAGYPEEKGDIIEVLETKHDVFYRVMSRHRRRVIGYYRDELELMERPEA